MQNINIQLDLTKLNVTPETIKDKALKRGFVLKYSIPTYDENGVQTRASVLIEPTIEELIAFLVQKAEDILVDFLIDQTDYEEASSAAEQARQAVLDEKKSRYRSAITSEVAE